MSLFKRILSSQKLPSVCLTVFIVTCLCVYFDHFLCLSISPKRQKKKRASRSSVVSKTTS